MLEANGLQIMANEVLEAARENLVIGSID